MNDKERRSRTAVLTFDICLILFEVGVLAWSIYTDNMLAAILIGVAGGLAIPTIIRDFKGGGKK